MAVRDGRPPLAEAGGLRAAALGPTCWCHGHQHADSIRGVRVAGKATKRARASSSARRPRCAVGVAVCPVSAPRRERCVCVQ